MRWLDRLKSDMRIYGINPEMATDRECWAVMVKRLVKVSIIIVAYLALIIEVFSILPYPVIPPYTAITL